MGYLGTQEQLGTAVLTCSNTGAPHIRTRRAPRGHLVGAWLVRDLFWGEVGAIVCDVAGFHAWIQNFIGADFPDAMRPPQLA
jgi:hypothetical protein